MKSPTFGIGDRVLVKDTSESGRIYKIDGEGTSREYWIDRGLTAHAHSPGQPIIYSRPDADGAFDPVGPYTAEQLRPWH